MTARARSHAASDLHPDRVTHDGTRLTFTSEAEFGPGGLFRTEFLGCRRIPLSPGEYFKRFGPRFTSQVPVVPFWNRPKARRAIRVEMIPDGCDEPVIAVLVTPGKCVHLPAFDGYHYREFYGAVVGLCDAP